MTPAERKLWLAAKNAPADMMLVTEREMAAIQQSLNSQRQLIAVHELGTHRIRGAVGPYIRTEPDLINSVGAATHDALVFKKASDLALDALNRAKKKLDPAITALDASVNVVIPMDLLAASREIDDAIKMIETHKAKRYERRLGPQAPNGAHRE